MENAASMENAATNQELDLDTTGPAPVARTQTPDRPRMEWAVRALLIATAALVVAGGFAVFERLRALDERILGLQQATQHLGDRLEAQGEQAEASRVELVRLRAELATRTGEDVIYLKIVLLRPRVDRSLARTIARHVRTYSELYGHDPDLVLSMMAVESNFDPNVVSHMGAVGLMQIMPQWKQVLGIKESLKSPETSIKYGLQIFGFYKEMYKDLTTALTAYNRGPGPVDLALMRGKDPTNRYAPRVLAKYEELRTLNASGT